MCSGVDLASKGCAFYTSEPRAQLAGDTGAAEPGWRTAWLPAGFTIAERKSAPLSTSRRPVEQFVYSDGLASVSVFIERLDDVAERLEGSSRMGAVNAFGLMVDEFQVTAVGEVPAQTVREVAQSVSRR